jgi:hypothetical protein
MCTAGWSIGVKDVTLAHSGDAAPVAIPQCGAKFMIGQNLNLGGQFLFRFQNSPSGPVLGCQSRASSTELSTGIVDNFT